MAVEHARRFRPGFTLLLGALLVDSAAGARAARAHALASRPAAAAGSATEPALPSAAADADAFDAAAAAAADDLLALAQSVGVGATRVGALEWARLGVDVWRRDLRRGVLPGSVADAQSASAAAAAVGVVAASAELWPGEPLLGELVALAAELRLPYLCARHAGLADAVVRALVRAAADFRADADAAAGAADAADPDAVAGARGGGARGGSAAARAAAAAAATAVRERWAPALGAVALLDAALDGRVDPRLLPLAAAAADASSPAAAAGAADAEAADATADEAEGAPDGPLAPAGAGPAGGAPSSAAAAAAAVGAPGGLSAAAGVWRASGWAALARLQRRVEGLPELRAFWSAVGRRAAADGPRRGRLPRQLVARPPAAAGVALGGAGAPPAEAGGVTRSAEWARALPSERALLALRGPAAAAGRALFRAKLADGALATIALDGWAAAPAKPRPRRAGAAAQRERTPLAEGGGPLLLCLDTSGSMEGGGAREALAKAAVLAAAAAAARERRPLRVLAFGGAAEVADSAAAEGDGVGGGGVSAPPTATGDWGDVLDGPRGLGRLLAFLGGAFGGGTDVVGALALALDLLEADGAADGGGGRGRGGGRGDGGARGAIGADGARPRPTARAAAATAAAAAAPTLRARARASSGAADLILITDGELPDPPADARSAARLAALQVRRGVRVHCLLLCAPAEAAARAARMATLCGDGGDGGGVHTFLCAEVERFYESATLGAGVGSGGGARPAAAAAPWAAHGRAGRGGAEADAEATGRTHSGFGAGAAPAWPTRRGPPRAPSARRAAALRGGFGGGRAGGGAPRRGAPAAVGGAARRCGGAAARASGLGGGGDAESGADAAAADAAALRWLASQRAELRAARDSLSVGLFEREGEAAMLTLAALAGEHALLIGPPGTGKSQLARRLAALLPAAAAAGTDPVTGAVAAGGVASAASAPLPAAAATTAAFECLLSKFTPPEELFGPLSLAALERDRYARVTAGYLPTATVAFLDEVFKANGAVLNSLLGILNERLFHGDAVTDDVTDAVTAAASAGTRPARPAGRAPTVVPLVTCVGASNELPDSDELGALYDRFLIRLDVRPLSDSGLLAMLGTAAAPGATPRREPAAATTAASAAAGGARPARVDLRRARAALGFERPAVAPPFLEPAAAAAFDRARPPRLASLERAVALPAHVGALLVAARAYCAAEWGEGARPSDRRLAQSARLLRVSAATHGRDAVGALDCMLLARTLCPEPALSAELSEFVRARAAPDPPVGSLRLVLAAAVGAAADALGATRGELAAARGVSAALGARLEALRADLRALRAAADAEGAALDLCAVELGLAPHGPAGAAGARPSPPPPPPPPHLWLTAVEEAAAVQAWTPTVRRRQAALGDVRALAARAEALLTPPAAAAAGDDGEARAAADAVRALRRLEDVAALTAALDDGGGSAAGRAKRAAAIANAAVGAAGTAWAGADADGGDGDGDGDDGAVVEFSDDELRLGVKEAKAVFKSPALFRAWKRAKRAAASAAREAWVEP